jgi:hypothetical protein
MGGRLMSRGGRAQRSLGTLVRRSALQAMALEREFEDATFARVRAGPMAAPDTAQLRDGTATSRVAFEWALQ